MTTALIAALLVLVPTADDGWIDQELPSLMDLYKHLHTHPELSLREVETANRIGQELTRVGCEVTPGIGKTGLVGLLRNGPGPVVLVRTDLDALPVTEATGLPHASKVTVQDDAGKTVGVMHACGHDVHMTCFVGAARWLAAHKDRWSGTVMFVGQPAEERVQGARAMLDDGLYERFGKPDYALALHVAHDLETGKVGYRSGPTMAGSTAMDVVVKGKGGHGAMPHNTIDPIVLASLLVLDLQTIVSREVQPIDPAVVTVGSIHGGSKHNIVPDDVRLQLTLRAFRPEVREQLIDGIRRRALGLAQAHRAPTPEFFMGESVPPTINTPSLAATVLPALKAAVGADNVVEVDMTMGAEDFGLFGQGGVPTFMYRLGTVPPARVRSAREGGEPLPSLHSSQYAPDPGPSIRVGIQSMTGSVVSLLPK